MSRQRTFFRLVLILAVITLLTGAIGPVAVQQASAAQNETPLIISIPSLWEDTLTPEILAEFEAQHAGVKVYLTYTDTSFFGFGGGAGAIDDTLDSVEESVTTADVLYIDPTSLTVSATQAGYFLDLAPLVMNDPALDPADFIPAVWQSYQWDNGVWALPLSTDVLVVSYDPAAFDAVGLAYPNERWTIDDFANAARVLTQYNADGTVSVPGMTTNSGGNNLSLFLRSLLSAGVYDAATMPNAPSFSDPALESILQTWYEMVQDGVVLSQGGGFEEDIPLQIGGMRSFSQRGFGGPNNDNDEESVRYASLLPGGQAGLTVQGFAVSAGTQSPELAYELAKFLTSRSELATNAFSLYPARYSLASTAEQNNNAGPGGGPGGGGPGGGNFFRNIPDEILPVVEQGLTVGLPISELRYASYLTSAANEMTSNGGDARSALQTIEAQAVSDVQTAQARVGTVALYVNPPITGPTLAAGEIVLNCALNQGFGGRMGGSQLPNQQQWDQVIADFVAADPLVGAVNIESVESSDLTTLAADYDCIILSTNVVQTGDLSAVLNLDPLMDTDPTFDRNDIIGNTLTQLQKDNKTWALPLAIEPQMLQYTQEKLLLAGVPEPLDGWTTDSFVDALRMLRPYETDPVPFVPNDPGGSYLLMLITAFGGLPIDYRTDPPTINFTDPANIDAIRQVLDLAINGYIGYQSNTIENAVDILGSAEEAPITTNSLNQFARFGPPGGRPGEETDETTTVLTTYPRGSQYSVVSYEITTGYVSATTQNPESTYSFLSTVAGNPQLFSGMPARTSLISDPAVLAAQGSDITGAYQQLDALLRDPNTIVFPTLTGGGGANITNFIQEYWLRRAFDNYVINGADLEYELTEAETFTRAYMECSAGIVVDTTVIDNFERQREVATQIMTCAQAADPDFGLMN
ncbi:MAG: extracellular solute-binding protein [Chloroflexi bacterium]|nr:extracellular solute-binding protein [Chloroflexota bacterium]